MPVSVRLSELSPITQAQLTDSDLFLVTDSEATSSKKLTVADLKQHLFSGNSFASFNDVDLVSTPPTDGQFLRYDASTQRWIAGDISLSSLGDLQDVDLQTVAPQDGQTLIWDGPNSRFEPGTIDLSPLWTLLGESPGDTDLGNFVGSIDINNMDVRTALQTLSNAITSNANTATAGIDDNELALQALTTRVTTAETTLNNLDIGLAPEDLNSLNELAAALGDDANFLTTLQTRDTQIEGQITSLAASTATDQTTQDGRLDQLEADVLALGQAGAPAQLDTINELATTLSKLVPLPPTTMAGLALTVNTNAGTRRLCSGFTDRTGGTSGLSAGSQVKRNTDGSITTNKIEDIGPGDSGEIQVKISQNSYTVTTNMASGTQVVDFMGLKITDNKDASLSTRDSGIPAGFYQVYDIQLVNAHLQHQTNGLHYVQFTHAGNATQKAYFYEDESNPGAPTLTASSVYLPDSPNLSYSSGVPHYTNHTDNNFTYSLIAQNLSGDMYIQNQLATSSQTAGFTHQGNKNYTDFGDGTNPPVVNFGVGVNKVAEVTQYPRDLHTQVSNNQFSNWTITTPYGSVSKRPSANMTFNIMGGTARTNVMDEDNILVSNLGSGAGNAYRVGDLTGNNPVSNQQDWDPLATPDAHEAIVVGGVLKHDRTDYSVGYRPVGPDLSGRSVDPQYAEFEIKRSGVSQFTITYSGSCSGCWVTMPNNTTWQTSLSGTNGWADMFQAYKGSGVPTSAEPGCSSGGLMDNNGGSFTCVFGTESSSNDSENSILVRWKLAEGQSITSMSFSA